jgi:hypothetical protein
MRRVVLRFTPYYHQHFASVAISATITFADIRILPLTLAESLPFADIVIFASAAIRGGFGS